MSLAIHVLQGVVLSLETNVFETAGVKSDMEGVEKIKAKHIPTSDLLVGGFNILPIYSPIIYPPEV